MNKQELIEKYKNLEGVWNANGAEIARQCFLRDLEQLNEIDTNTFRYRDVVDRLKELAKIDRVSWITKIMEDFRQECDMISKKVTVPQFVADYIKDAKYYEWDLDDVFDHIAEESEESEIYKWFYTLGNVDVFARAWLDGYTVDKEKRYLVKMKNLRALFCYLAYIPDEGYWTLMASGGESIVIKHTRKELEEAGFGEVFNSPLFEVEEVEEVE